MYILYCAKLRKVKNSLKRMPRGMDIRSASPRNEISLAVTSSQHSLFASWGCACNWTATGVPTLGLKRAFISDAYVFYFLQRNFTVFTLLLLACVLKNTNKVNSELYLLFILSVLGVSRNENQSGFSCSF